MKNVQKIVIALFLIIIMTATGSFATFADDVMLSETTKATNTTSETGLGEENASDQTEEKLDEESNSSEVEGQEQAGTEAVEQEKAGGAETSEEGLSEEKTTEMTPTLTGEISGTGTENNYLTFTAKEENSSVTFNYADGSDVKYSLDGGITWTDYTNGIEMSLVNVGDSVSFKGTNVTTNSSNHFSMTGKIAASGDVTSLTNGIGGDCTLSENCYTCMFSGCTSLTEAPALPATTLAGYCYNSMFSGCTSLIEAPALPATSLAGSCYNCMFSGCTSLTEAPALPATTLAGSCYDCMFSGCTNLNKAPALPATTLEGSCYTNMFLRCTSLTEAPALPATTLASYCYNCMFSGCTSLTDVPTLPATTLASYCYYCMFSGCTSLKKAPAILATTLANSCCASMFSDCTSLNEAPALLATTLAVCCYSSMFSGCTSLNKAPALPATTLTGYCYASMFSGCTSLVKAPALPATTLDSYCYYKMFSGCTSLIEVPSLPATDLTSRCYTSMFSDCTGIKISSVKTEECSQEWFLPSDALAATSWNKNMLKGTGGTFTGDPEIGTVYYMHSEPHHTYAELQALIADVETTCLASTTASANAAEDALATARAITEGSAASEIDNAYIALEEAKQNLVPSTVTIVLTSDPEGAALSGGGRYAAGDVVKLTTKLSGYTFLGWYIGETPLDGSTYTVAASDTGTITITAKLQANATQNLTVNVGSGKVEYEVNSNTRTLRNNLTNESVPKGTGISLTAVPNEGYQFLYWVDGSKRVVSTEVTYSMTIGADTELTAFYILPDDDENCYVVFKDMNSKVLWSGDVTKGNTVKAPEHLNFTGFEFTGWDKELTNVQASMIVNAKYSATSGLTLTVNGELRPRTYTYGQMETVTADATKGSKYFSGWYCNGTLVSQLTTYTFFMTGNMELEAQYNGDSEIELTPFASMMLKSRVLNEDGTGAINLITNYNVPKGYSLVQVGLIRTFDSTKTESLTLENVDGSAIKKNTSSAKAASGIYDFTLSLSTASVGKTLYSRGYLTYENATTGEVLTLYTNLVTSTPVEKD